ncbi:hypothetical protein [Nevskia sp.]|uniref:hypothetical protein n=1 Tax=Nevskia sp. TaxID=1929292 RepID=UPI0025FAFF35|nr:hypothetical protein [Nevskia sp.]
MNDSLDIAFPPTEGAAEPTQPLTPMDAIRRRFAAPEWIVMGEVAPATGGGTRYADAIAVNTWQSRGHAVIGFEVKVSRSDWLRELKQPEKAEPMLRYCDRWYLVATKDVVKPGELPPNWGHLELRQKGLHMVTEAPKLEAKPITRSFFASLMRRGYEEIDAVATRMQRQAIADARAEVDNRVARLVREKNGGTRKARAHDHRVHGEDRPDDMPLDRPANRRDSLGEAAGAAEWLRRQRSAGHAGRPCQ